MKPYEIKKEKQTQLVKTICETCFNNNVSDNIKISDNTFTLCITKPNDTIDMNELLFGLDGTSVRDVRFSRAPSPYVGIEMTFATHSTLAVSEEYFTKLKNREKLTFVLPTITNICPRPSTASSSSTTADELWVKTISDHLFKHMPINISHGVSAFRSDTDLWVHAYLEEDVYLNDLKTCVSLSGVRTLELETHEGVIQLKMFCGLQKKNLNAHLKQQKHVTNGTGQNVLSSKQNVRRIFREEGMDKRQKQNRGDYVPEQHNEYEFVSGNELDEDVS